MLIEVYFTRGEVDDTLIIEAETDEEARDKVIAFFDARGMSVEKNYTGSREIKAGQ